MSTFHYTRSLTLCLIHKQDQLNAIFPCFINISILTEKKCSKQGKMHDGSKINFCFYWFLGKRSSSSGSLIKKSWFSSVEFINLIQCCPSIYWSVYRHIWQIYCHFSDIRIQNFEKNKISFRFLFFYVPFFLLWNFLYTPKDSW